MLERVDRVQLAVRDRQAAARTFGDLLGAEVIGEDGSAHLAARRTILGLGETAVELCEPAGEGIVAGHLDAWGEGLIGAGFSVADLPALRAHLLQTGVPVADEGDQVYVEPAATSGLRVVLSPDRRRPRIGLVSGLYEVTHVLRADWHPIVDRYAALFALDASRFCPIASDRFGYAGTLTLFDPPARLDRVEVIQVVDPASAMGRWVARHGDGLYMAYVETDDVRAIIARLDATKARFTPRGDDARTERDGLWIHPSALHGLLLGVSRRTLAWEWSGRPELVTRA